MMRLLIPILFLVACGPPSPSPAPAPTSAPSCVAVCNRMAAMSCPGTVTACLQACSNKAFPWNVECRSSAPSCAKVDACEQPRVP
jgi:hypothetical protein